MTITDTIRTELDRQRKARKWSLREWARQSGVSYPTVFFFVHGGGVRSETMDKLTACLKGKTIKAAAKQ